MEMSTVRTAGPEDEAQVLELCYRLHAENGKFKMSREKVIRWVHGCLYPEDREGGFPPGIIGVIGEPDRLEGLILLMISNFWFAEDDDAHIEEFLNYVPPEYRKSCHAKSLIEFAIKCSNNLVMPLMIGVMSDHRMEAKVRLYRRQLPLAGHFFFHDPRKTEAA